MDRVRFLTLSEVSPPHSLIQQHEKIFTALTLRDADAAESGGDDDEDEGKPADKKAGRRKIKIEFIQDKSRRHITFSKRKAGQSSSVYNLSRLPVFAHRRRRQATQAQRRRRRARDYHLDAG